MLAALWDITLRPSHGLINTISSRKSGPAPSPPQPACLQSPDSSEELDWRGAGLYFAVANIESLLNLHGLY